MYPHPEVASLISLAFIPARAHVKENSAAFERFRTQWTPTVVILDPDGIERYRFEGYLPPDDFMAALELGLGHAAFGQKNWSEAEQRFRAVVDRFPSVDAAPEALYWAGVSRYKRTSDAAALADTARQFKERYAGTSWAKKSSVWGG